jgi:hypothetical protein
LPIGHAVSLALPTLRLGFPAVTAFAAPAVRREGDLRQFPPDRWWAVGASTGRLAFYAVTAAVPLSPQAESWAPLDIQPLPYSIEELENRLAALDSIIDVAAGRFWGGQSPERGPEIARAIEGTIPPDLVGQHRALAPDFWAWLSPAAIHD